MKFLFARDIRTFRNSSRIFSKSAELNLHVPPRCWTGTQTWMNGQLVFCAAECSQLSRWYQQGRDSHASQANYKLELREIIYKSQISQVR